MIFIAQFLLAAILLTSATAASAQVDQKVRDVLMPMTHFIEKSTHYRMELSISNDAVLESGQKIELGSQVTASIQKPSKARIEFEYRNGERAMILMDGTKLAVLIFTSVGIVLYDSVDQPGDIDTSLRYLSDVLHTEDQLKGFFSINFSERLHGIIQQGAYLGVASLAGVECDNLAMRSDENDIQLWVRKEGDPLPHRLVVYYTQLEGLPGYRVNFKNWDFAPDFSEELFDVSIPPDAKRVEYFPKD